ncbi:uncharacterized protein MONOS_2135 [Monocercomonoides exilis]|uniref:uncharacterized protein n=1 Tax=Monocercomonoides exilis TaxID=2049356 RepID=UPI0035593DB5|nr:hypothetical protein MONOS_2135 [Monocercomonoides exilis]|eukprot:MONOS_2135.1-p1 / transcript=MONOS_2135.1 / gene=MONOS_2135 / organism=Monocercomonoides_exilis_PA203 / gene_product=unspecified product / transcript_product=unspecified product / location=Mono_scaffold00042:67385-68191(+) / protein_length=269 / sequence_SO=supercontig / SO=protein_coding / is_pseudo=false
MLQGTEHPPFLPQPSDSPQSGACAQGSTAQAETPRASPIDSFKNVASMGALQISNKEGGQHKLDRNRPQQQLGELPRSQSPFLQLPRGYREEQQQEHLLEQTNGPRREIRASPRDRVRRESRALSRDRDGQNAIEFRRNDNAKWNPIQSAHCNKKGAFGRLREYRRDTELILSREELKSRYLERSRDGNIEREHRSKLSISPQDKTQERSEIREGGREGSLESFWDCYQVPNWEYIGGELEDSYCRHFRRRREYTDAAWPQDARIEEE